MLTPPEKPAGDYERISAPTHEERVEMIAEIEHLPVRVAKAVEGFSETQIDVKYKNWTIRQIVHHLADSHMNAVVRFRLALTEDKPTIKPYDEGRWAELADAKTCPVPLSLTLLSSLHTRWVLLLRSMSDSDFARCYYHPESKRDIPLGEALGMYAHHGRHHAAQIEWLRIQFESAA